MWHPPERIRHPLPETRWPTREEAESSQLYSPIDIGPVKARQRTWVPAMVPWRATDDGFVTGDVIDWYARFAAGRPGVLVVEATGIRDIPSGPLLRIGHERFIPGLRKLVDRVREASGGETRLFIQLIDFLRIRRRPTKEAYFGRHLELGPQHRERLAHLTSDGRVVTAPEQEVRAALQALDEELLGHILSHREMEDYLHGYRERVWDTHLEHIRELPQVLPDLFAQGAENAFAAGFDGVELHYAHAYTMASFLSALNTRDDQYGGPPENRVRLPLEVLAAVRARVGREHVVGVRFLGDDVVEGGNRIDDAQYFAVELARGGADYLSVSKGGKFEDAQQPKVGRAAYPYTGPSGYECMPTVFSDERGAFRAQRRAVRRDPQLAARSRPGHAGGGLGRHLHLRAGRGDPARRRRRHRGGGAPESGRPGLVPEDEAGPRRRDPHVRVHQLLRGPRPEPQAGHLQAVGPRRARRPGRDARRVGQAAAAGAALDAGAADVNVFLTALGCRLNEAEVEAWARSFRAAGHAVVASPASAQVMVVNTCAVTSEAARKSRKLVGGLHRRNPSARLVVTGCFAELEPAAAAALYGVDLVVGNGDKDRLVARVATELDVPAMPVLAADPDGAHAFREARTRAFVKVQDGCRNQCSFCVVTIARGEERSRTVEEVIAEVRGLEEAGTTEVVLCGVHLGGYGSDLGLDLSTLVRRLLRATSVPRVRLSSLEPWGPAGRLRRAVARVGGPAVAPPAPPAAERQRSGAAPHGAPLHDGELQPPCRPAARRDPGPAPHHRSDRGISRRDRGRVSRHPRLRGGASTSPTCTCFPSLRARARAPRSCPAACRLRSSASACTCWARWPHA